MAEGQVLVLDAEAFPQAAWWPSWPNSYCWASRWWLCRLEGINISGNFYRNKLKYLAFLRSKCTPTRTGPHHFHSTTSGPPLPTVQGVLPTKDRWKPGCPGPPPASEEVTAILEEKGAEKTKIHYRKIKQLMRLQKQAGKNMEKKMNKLIEVLRTHGLCMALVPSLCFVVKLFLKEKKKNS
uniref:Uncharacterized protein n=1 Tax=Sciurus vulgaris TaxID=55149 RepID=A0A8D2AVZ1_SCIVU